MTYFDMITQDYASGLVALWQLKETSGTTATDASPNALNGTYGGGFTLNAALAPVDGYNAPSFDGSTGRVNIYSAGLNTNFNGAENTTLVWGQVNGSADWTDGSQHQLLCIRVDVNNRLELRKTTTNNQLSAIVVSGATTKQVTSTANTPTTWFMFSMTNSKAADQLKAYYNGVQLGSTQTGLGVWAGALASANCAIAATSSSGSNSWKGNIYGVAVWSTILTAADMARIYAGDVRPFPEMVPRNTIYRM